MLNHDIIEYIGFKSDDQTKLIMRSLNKKYKRCFLYQIRPIRFYIQEDPLWLLMSFGNHIDYHKLVSKAIQYHRLDIIEWLKTFYKSWNSEHLTEAISVGFFDLVKWLKEQGCPWDSKTFKNAARHGNLDNMKWMKEQGCPWNDVWTFAYAAKHGNLDNMKWLKEQGCPWDSKTFENAAELGNPQIVDWLNWQKVDGS